LEKDIEVTSDGDAVDPGLDVPVGKVIVEAAIFDEDDRPNADRLFVVLEGVEAWAEEGMRIVCCQILAWLHQRPNC
jgi:hypothetical protein